MITADTTYIEFRISYARPSWGILISSLIRPFFKVLNSCGRNIEYRIYVGMNRGDHIRVLLPAGRVNNEIIESFGQKTEHFLCLNPSEGTREELPVYGIFRKFENNTFIVRERQDGGDPLNGIEVLFKELAGCFSDIFSKDEISGENILSFMIYLKISLLKTIVGKISDVHCFLERNDCTGVSDSSPDSLKVDFKRGFLFDWGVLNEMFKTNKDIVNEIFTDIWSASGYDQELEWLIAWEDKCGSVIQPATLEYYYQVIFDQLCLMFGIGESDFVNKISDGLILASVVDYSNKQ
jgi:hypothetical protein